MPVGTRNTSPEQMAANLAAYKAKIAAKLEARKAKATSSAEVDELSSLLSRVSMSSSVDDLDDLMKGLSMGGRRRTRKQKHKGKKHPRKTRKSRRGGVLPQQRMSLTEAEEKYRKEFKALKKTGNASPAEIAAAEKKWTDAYVKMRSVLGHPEPGYPHGMAHLPSDD